MQFTKPIFDVYFRIIARDFTFIVKYYSMIYFYLECLIYEHTSIGINP